MRSLGTGEWVEVNRATAKAVGAAGILELSNFSIGNSQEAQSIRAEDAAWAATVREWDQHRHGKAIAVMRTPAVLRKLGIEDLPIQTTPAILAKVTGGKHTLEIDSIKDLPARLRDPVAIF